MTKDEAIKYLNEFIVLKKISNITEEKAIECFKLAVEALEQEQQPRWVPCSERLPKENEYVGNVCKYYLIQDEYGDMHVAHLSNVGWIPMDSLKAIGDEIIAWRELPEPYVPDINVGNINCILDKISKEIKYCREDEEPHLVDYRYYRNEGLDMALDIIDKYKAESEVQEC